MDEHPLQGQYTQTPGSSNPRGTFTIKEEASMNQEQATGKFDQLKGKLKETWGRLTDDEIALYAGKRDQFFGKLEEKYGVAKEDAEEKIREMDRISSRYGSDKAA